MLDQLQRKVAMLQEAIAHGREVQHPLGHVLGGGGYGMMKASHPEEFAEVAEALNEAKSLDATHETIREMNTVLRGVAPSKVSIRLYVGIRGALLTQDEMFAKLQAAMPDHVEEIGEDQVRAAVASSFKRGENHEQHAFEIYAEDIGRDAMIDIMNIVQPKIPHGDKAAVARQLRAMADAFENGEG